MSLIHPTGLSTWRRGPNADFFAATIEDVAHLIVPTISLLVVFKRVLQQRNENDALHVKR